MQLEEVNCPVCKGEPAKRLKFRSTFVTSELSRSLFAARNDFRHKHFQIMECTGCKMWISDPSLRGAKLYELYEGAEHNYHDLEPYIRLPYAKLLKNLGQKTESRNHFVEVGGGNGFLFDLPFLDEFNQKTEVEPNAKAEKDFLTRGSKGTFIRSSLSEKMFPQNSISMAAFFHVLDHLEEPLRFLRELFDFIEPGGGVASVVHNTKALSAKILGKKTPILGVWHTFLYNSENIRQLFAMAGFTSIEVSVIRNTYPLWYWMDHLPFSEKIRKQNRRFLTKTHFANIPISAYAGNLGITARKVL